MDKVQTMALALFVGMTPLIASGLDIKDDDLLLYFLVTKDGDLVDKGPHANDGIIDGTVDIVEGHYGEAMDFGEQGQVIAPYIELNDRSFTVSMWVNPRQEGGDQQCVLSQTQVNAQNTSLHYRLYTNGTTRMGFYSNDLDAPASLIADEWQHVCFWLDVDNDDRRIYVNGEQVAQDAGKAGIAYLGTAGDTYIGSWGATGQKFNGLIDEVQIWNRALSDQDILDSMLDLNTFGVDAAGKVATTWAGMKRVR
jgi:hypothetical protein